MLNMQKILILLSLGFALPAAAQQSPLLRPNLPVISASPTHTHPHENVDKDDATQSPKDRIVFLLSGYHYFPTMEDLAKIGDEATVSGILRELAQDPAERPTLRMRALDALMYFSDGLTLAYVEHTALTEPAAAPELLRTEQLMQHHAIMTLAKIRKEESSQILKPLLNHSDIQVQMTVISALGKHGGKTGKALLEESAKGKHTPAVQRELRKYVRF